MDIIETLVWTVFVCS